MVKPNALPDPGAPAPLGDGFLYAARLSPEKGLGLLLDAWRRHPDGSLGPLRIAGDGELRPLAEQAAAERADVTYLGPLDRAGMRGRRRAASAPWSSPPTWHDVLPTVVLEALAAGRPVLGTERRRHPVPARVDAAATAPAGSSSRTRTPSPPPCPSPAPTPPPSPRWPRPLPRRPSTPT